MNAKFTPGPWQLKQNENCKHKDLQVWTKHGYMVGTKVIKVDETRLDGESWLDMRERTEAKREQAKEEANANVALIACAPDMYEMLESKLDLIRCGIGANYSGDPKQNPKYLEVVELLKRARGEL